MAEAYDGYADYGSYGGYGYGSDGYYAVYYRGPYFLDLRGQLSGPGSSAYESLHSVGDTYVKSPTGLYQTSYASEGADGSIYQRATNAIDDIQPYSGGPRYVSPTRGAPVYSEYQTQITLSSSQGSYSGYYERNTTYTTQGFSFSGCGPIADTYSTDVQVRDHFGDDYIRNGYSTSATYYTSGAVERSALNSYSAFDDGQIVPGSIYETGYRSYTDAYGTTTTSYIDTRPAPAD